MAILGIYSQMANGINSMWGHQTFSTGAVTVLAGLSSGELINSAGSNFPDYYVFSSNKLTSKNSFFSQYIWSTAYAAIYGANAVIEGIEASTAVGLSDSVRKELTGESKFIRAFAYFYLTNLYGDVPLALTVDFNKTISLPRARQQDVYTQIIKDLKDAMALLPRDYSVGNGERIRVNYWAAAAILARVYLYTGDNTNAAALCTEIINHNSLFKLEIDLNSVFLTGSQEVILQLASNTSNYALGNGTYEGKIMVPYPINTGIPDFAISQNLKNAFEANDKRWTKWTNTTDASVYGQPKPIAWYPYKYKTYIGNAVQGAPAVERNTLIRLAEIHLIRAEAIANGAPGNLSDAIDDLNLIRNRADLGSLLYTLTKEQVIEAIAKERQTELFAEWGHRWFDLKRTGKAHDVLSANPIKLPWAGDYQLLYPIPWEEILKNHFLIQNPGY